MRTSLTGRPSRYRPSTLLGLGYLQARVDDRTRALVALAARRLDAVDPTWWTRVDRATLDLADPRRCLLAQVFGGYELGLDRLYGNHLGSPTEGAAFTGRVSELLWFDEVNRRAREAAASDREFECVAS